MGLYSNDGSYFITPVEDLLTDGGDGPNRRLRVDVAQTGFFAGREFRTFFEISTAAVIQAVVPLNIILFGLNVDLLEGEFRIETVVGGTPSGTFATPLPIFNRNTMTEVPSVYLPATTLNTGGTHTGGTVLDILVGRTSDVANFASSVGSASNDERGVGAGTYYFRITVTGTTRGVFKARWEERP